MLLWADGVQMGIEHPIQAQIMSSYSTPISTVRTGDVSSHITPESIAKKWMVCINTAKEPLQVTAQKGIRTIPGPAMRCFRTQMTHLRYPRLKGTFFADLLMESKSQSIERHRYAHIIKNGHGFTNAYPMVRKNESIYTLDDFVKRIKIPEVLIAENNLTMQGFGEWKKRVQKYGIDPRYTEPYSPFQNKAELDIRELKRMMR